MSKKLDYRTGGEVPPPQSGSGLPQNQQMSYPVPYAPPPPEDMGTGKILGLSALACCVPVIGPLISLIIGIVERAKRGAVIVMVIAAVNLFVTPAIVGIVATIAIPVTLSARQSAIDEKARNSLRAVVSAEAAYYAKHSEYADFDALEAGLYIDSRYADNELGQGINILVAPVGGGPAFTCTIEGAYLSFTADETGIITDHSL